MLIDTHCHLYFKQFDDDRDTVIERMKAAGIAGSVVIGIDTDTNAQAAQLATDYAEFRYSVGLHPTSEFPNSVKTGAGFNAAEYLAPWLKADSRPVAIGECGIDLHWDTNPLDQQQLVFVAQLRLAAALELPVVVHTRNAGAQTREALEQVPEARGILHCFDGSPELLDYALNRGRENWYVSFAGNLTFPKAQVLRDAALEIPVERLLVETDAPFLAPQPKRGKRNEPAYVVHVANLLAELKGLPPVEMIKRLRTNAEDCFQVTWDA